MLRNFSYITLRSSLAAAVLALAAATSGCALWQRENWDLNRLRDDRAVDIDQRLEGTKPIVPNPF